MTGSLVVDLVLVIVLLAFLVSGFRQGFASSLGAILGFLVGGVAAFFVAPLVGTWVTDAAWRAPAVLVAVLLLVAGGTSAGTAVGHAARRRLERSPLRAVDRVLGALLSVIVAALVASILAFTVGSLGVPALSPAVASSAVVRTIDQVTPAPLRVAIAQARAFALSDGLPRIVDAAAGPAPEIPAETAPTEALRVATQSVVRVTGTAFACGQNQTGSGFVVAGDRVITNAHVVAGVVEPVVQTPAGQALPGRVVYFDPVDDLAIIRVSGLDAPALTLGEDLTAGTEAVTAGYPYGGPFDADAALVVGLGAQRVADIYGGESAERVVATLASDVQQGESGGPVLSADGLVRGVVFAKAADRPGLGYALAMAEVAPVAASAAGLMEPVSSGRCAAA